jgi:2-polyprenyl-3-methyl-5-hydroxy-6-metoxy-1,4-benzoquinol methylase
MKGIETLKKYYKRVMGVEKISHEISAVREDIAQSTVKVREDLSQFLVRLSFIQEELNQYRRFLQYTRSLHIPDIEYERIEPGDPEQRILYMRHLVAYRYIYQKIRTGNRVVDIGCGEGYGPYLLSTRAAEVIGYDVNEKVMISAREKYCRFANNLSFKTYDGLTIPEKDGTCDQVTCFQVIEHIANQERFLEEIKRILKPQGTVAISTPNRLTFSPDGKLHPFHVREFTAEEFRSTLEKYFSVTELFGLHSGLTLSLHKGLEDMDYGRRGKMIRDVIKNLPSSIQNDLWRMLSEESAMFSVDMADTGHFFLSDKNLAEALDLIGVCHSKKG